jgi:uncharacterized protein
VTRGKHRAVAGENAWSAAGHEFATQQLPMIAIVAALGVAAAWLEYGFVPNGDAPFAKAGVAVGIWHLVCMGIFTGYTMALVGQAAGIFALPYSTSVLQFSNPHVSATMLVVTFLNPIGALLGFRRSGQWNLDFALPVCLGGVVGALVGPILRATVLANASTFRLALGAALALFGVQLCWNALRDYSTLGRTVGSDFLAAADDGGKRFSIKTVSNSLRAVTIRFGSHQRELPHVQLFLIGAGVGVFSAALGVGGGFLLVPIFATAYRLPLYVMVAATIPYTIVLSLVGILAFIFLLPALGTPSIAPEWSWGFFTAAGGIFGSWCAAKTQLYFPEHLLNWLLGGITGFVGAIYMLSFVVKLPFAL